MMQQAIRPGKFGKTVCADARRVEFDWKNDTILSTGVRPDAVFIGDSITELWELTVFFHNASCLVNRGIGGDEMYYIARRFEADAVQLHPRCCVLLGGINDSWSLEYNPAEFTGGEHPDALLARVKDYFASVLDMASRAELPMAVCSVLPVNMPYRECDGVRNEYICRLNEHLQVLCERYGMLYVDYHTALTDDSGKRLRRELSYEGLHVNADGYTIMADILKSALAQRYGIQL